jgi:hypothetical protein
MEGGGWMDGWIDDGVNGWMEMGDLEWSTDYFVVGS